MFDPRRIGGQVETPGEHSGGGSVSMVNGQLQTAGGFDPNSAGGQKEIASVPRTPPTLEGGPGGFFSNIADKTAAQYKQSGEKILSEALPSKTPAYPGESVVGVASGAMQGLWAPVTATMQEVADRTGVHPLQAIGHTEVGQKIQEVMKAHPEASKNVLDLINVLAGVFGAKGLMSGATGKALRTPVGEAVTDVAKVPGQMAEGANAALGGLKTKLAKGNVDPRLQASAERLPSASETYNQFADQAQKATSDVKAPAPLESVGGKIGDAYDKVVQMRREVGKQMDTSLKGVGNTKVNVSDSIGEFESTIEDKFGVKFNPKTGELKPTAGQTSLSSMDQSLITKYIKELKGLGTSPTVSDLDRFMKRIPSELDVAKASANITDVTPGEAFIKGNLSKLREAFNPDTTGNPALKPYFDARSQYADLSKFLDEGSKYLGAKTQAGEYMRDTSMAKSSLESILTGGKKDWLMELENKTNYPALDEGTLALQAMKDVGDARGTSLLKILSETPTKTPSGLIDKVFGWLADKGKQKIVGSPAEQTKTFLKSLEEEVKPEAVGPNMQKGAIANPFFKTSSSDVTSTINRHLTSAQQAIDNISPEEFKSLGGEKALMAQTQDNIVQGLEREGFHDAATAVEDLNPADYSNFAMFQKEIMNRAGGDASQLAGTSKGLSYEDFVGQKKKDWISDLKRPGQSPGQPEAWYQGQARDAAKEFNSRWQSEFDDLQAGEKASGLSAEQSSMVQKLMQRDATDLPDQIPKEVYEEYVKQPVQEIPVNAVNGLDHRGLILGTEKAGRKITMPILVDKMPDGSYQLVDGNHRLTQALMNRETTIRAFVKDASAPTEEPLVFKPHFPKEGSIEDVTNRAEGWDPGDKVIFDKALMAHDSGIIDAMMQMHRVPTNYVKQFSNQISNLLKNKGVSPESQLPSAAAAFLSLDPTQKEMVKEVSDLITRGEKVGFRMLSKFQQTFRDLGVQGSVKKLSAYVQSALGTNSLEKMAAGSSNLPEFFDNYEAAYLLPQGKQLTKADKDKLNAVWESQKIKPQDLTPRLFAFNSPEVSSTGIPNLRLLKGLRGPTTNEQVVLYDSPVANKEASLFWDREFRDSSGYPLIDSSHTFAMSITEDIPGNKRRVIAQNSSVYQNAAMLDQEIADSSGAHKLELENLKKGKQEFLSTMLDAEVKRAAKDGKSSILFPRGNTFPAIMGITNNASDWLIDGKEAKPEDFKAGQVIVNRKAAEVYQTNPDEFKSKNEKGPDAPVNLDQGQAYVVVTPPENGHMRVIYNHTMGNLLHEYKSGKNFFKPEYLQAEVNLIKRHFLDSTLFVGVDGKDPSLLPERFKEQARDLYGNHAKSKYNAQKITDDKGLEWWEIKVPKK